MVRRIIVEGTEYPDPSPESSIDEIQQMLASFMPEMATADRTETKQGNDTIFQFKKKVGTKGAGRNTDS